MNNPQQVTTLSGVPRTLLLTTRSRVEEHERPDGLFRDPQLAEWWPSLQWDPALDRMYTPLSQLSWAIRAHLFDQAVQRHLATYPNAVVIELGAGLSTRYYRVGERCRCWIELDLPEVTALRHQLDTERDQHRFISCSALDLQWLDQIPEGPPEELLILAEGLFMYFEAAEIQSLISQLNHRFMGATLVFDGVGGITKGKIAQQLAQLGAPLKWLIRDERDLSAIGLRVTKVQSLIQENCRYPHRIGWFRWLPWLSKLPPIRNASLIIEARLKA